jgi:hypothetical protein
MTFGCDDALRLVSGDRSILWRAETRHEAMLLAKTMFEKCPECRDELTGYVVAGPPEAVEQNEQQRGRDVFEILVFLESTNIPLPGKAKNRLGQIREKYPEWKARAYPGLTHYPVEVVRHEPAFSVAEILQIPPDEIAQHFTKHQDGAYRSARDFYETVGAAIVQDPAWGLAALQNIQAHLSTIPKSLNPTLWGMRARISATSAEQGAIVGPQILGMFQAMLRQRPEPEFWSSLATVIREMHDCWKVKTSLWHELAMTLADVVADFDSEQEEEVPVEWIQRAINHPIGEMTELYLKVAQTKVAEDSKEGTGYTLESHSREFFERVLSKFAKGTRYGLCLLAQHLSWFEAIDRQWAVEKLLPYFDWSKGENQALIAWSGYLWSRVLSRSLVARFEDSYLPTVKHWQMLAEVERAGFSSHVAAIVWFGERRVQDLEQVSDLLSTNGRAQLLADLEQLLRDSEGDLAERFFENVILPYWEWCGRQDFFQTSSSDEEKARFWDLVPHAYGCFPKAVKMAVKFKPSAVKDLSPLLEKMVHSELIEKYPKQAAEFFSEAVQLDSEAPWHREEWSNVWHHIRELAQNDAVDRLMNELARKGVLPD